MSEPKQYPELKRALLAFRELFMNNRIPVRNIQPYRDFLSRMRESEEWTAGDAVKVYKIIEPYKDSLKRSGFDFATVPRVQIYASDTNTRNIERRMSRFVRYDGTVFQIFFAFEKEIYDSIKKVKGSKWHQDARMWTIPFAEIEFVKALTQKYGFQIGESAWAILHNVENNLEASYRAGRVDLDIPLKMELFDFQTGGADYAIKNERVIIGDVMGLGKTCQAIASVMGIQSIKKKDSFPCIVVCPKPLRTNWRKEWTMWTDKKAVILDHKNVKHMHRSIEMGIVDVVITNFEGVKTFLVESITEYEAKHGDRMITKKRVNVNDLSRMFRSIIIDESHILRNPKTIVHKTAKAVARNTDFRFALTGTPIVTSPRDLGSLLDIIGRVDDFGGMHKFITDSRKMRKDTLNEKGSDDIDLKALNIKLRSTCFIRREKHQVLKDLPDKMRHIVNVDIDNRDEYDTAFFSLQEYLAQKEYTVEQIQRALAAELLVKLGHLKQISAKGKLSAVKNFIEECMTAGEQVGVFCWYKDTAKFIRDNFEGVVMITGDQTDDEIDRNKQAFQDGHARIIVCTYKKAATGHTLTAASKMLSIELPWTYADMVQAEDRFHRIGQVNDVDCYYFIGEDTFDEDIYQILLGRMNMERDATDSREEIATNQYASIAEKLHAGIAQMKTPVSKKQETPRVNDQPASKTVAQPSELKVVNQQILLL